MYENMRLKIIESITEVDDNAIKRQKRLVRKYLNHGGIIVASGEFTEEMDDKTYVNFRITYWTHMLVPIRNNNS